MLISVVIPIYNGEKYIERCLSSVLESKSKEYEIILVNDGSTDNTEKICKKYVTENVNIKYIYQNNSGVSTARNKGISISEGKYLLFLDCDDYLLNNWFEECHEALSANNYDVDILFFDYYSKNVNGERKKVQLFFGVENKQISNEIKKKYLYSDLLNAPWAKLFNKKFIMEKNILFPKGIKIGEDAIFIGNLLLKNAKTSYSSLVFFTYIINESSASYSNIDSFSDKEKLFFTKKLLLDQGNFSSEEKYIFFEKFTGDFISTLKYYSQNSKVNDFIKRCAELAKSDEVNVLKKCNNLRSIRRKMQWLLFTKNFYKVLFFEVKFEKMIGR